MRILLLVLFGIGLNIPSIYARPVSYPGGWTLMLKNDGFKHSAHIHYSSTVSTSIGYKFEDWRDQEFTVNAIQMNNLLKRWNKKNSQANLYLKSGIGIANSNTDNKNHIAGFTGFAADWEDRQYFIAYRNRYTDAGDIDNFYQQSIRTGWAPYEGDYGDLHTWIMLDVLHRPEADDQFTVTPLVRLFKDVHLVEAGINNHGDIMFNYIFRY